MMRLALALATALAIAGIGGPVAAADEPPHGHAFIHDVPSGWLPVRPDQYHYSRSFGGWVDDRCGTSQEGFRLIIYKDSNYGGAKTRVCHSATNRTGTPTNDSWCEVPLGNSASWQAVDACHKAHKNWGVANDRMSSFKVYGLTSSECLRFFADADHKGRWLTRKWNTKTLHDNTWVYPNSTYRYADRISSTIKKAGSACGTTYGSN